MIKFFKKLIVPVIIVAILVVSFIYGNDSVSEKSNNDITKNVQDVQIVEHNAEIAGAESVTDSSQEKLPEQKTELQTEKQPQATPAAEPVTEKPKTEEATVHEPVLSCSLSVRCDDILNNIQNLNKEKIDLVPKDGKIFENKNAVFYEGESVFNVLVRELKKNKIHYEFTHTPIYNSNYINGIGNLYEFDCGELSGWLYKVNGTMPSYGCSQYTLKDKDVVEFVYTCNRGI